MIAQLATLQRLLLRQAGDNSTTKQDGSVHFDRKLLSQDFDYGSDEEEDHHTSPKTAPSTGLESVGR